MEGVALENLGNPYYNYSFTMARKQKIYGRFSDVPSFDTLEVKNFSGYEDLKNSFEKIKSQEGFIGKLWDKTKNALSLKNSPNHIEAKLTMYRDGLLDYSEVQESINSYIKSHKKTLDFFADWGAAGAGALAFLGMGFLPFASVPMAIGAAALSGGLFKSAFKAIDAKTGHREYKTMPYDILTGAIAGFLSPIMNGLGSMTTKALGQTLGLNVVSKPFAHSAKRSAQGAIGSAIESVALFPKQKMEGNIIKRLISYGIGKFVRGVTKFGLALGIREYAIHIFSSSSKLQKNSILMKTMSVFTKEEQDFLKKKIGDSEIDFSNDVYETIPILE